MLNEGITSVNFFGIAFTLTMGFFLILLPRRYAVIPVIITACYITMGQRLVVFSLNFTMMRVLVLFGWARLTLRHEFEIRLNAIDKAIMWWTASSIITYTLLWWTAEALVNRMGVAFNAIGMYFMFRCLVRDFEGIKTVIKALALITVPLAAAMLLEKSTARNIFAVFGGVPEFTGARDGVLRSQGSFGHPILAGTFGATLMALFVSLWYQDRGRLLAAAGLISASVITFTSGSSGPAMAYIFTWIALGAWTLRRHMREVRWFIALSVIGLHLMMKAPVWFMIARVNVFSGSTGYHRAQLIDRAVSHLGEWWLIGTQSTAHWAWHLFDITNQYILEGVEGGLITMAVFIYIIVLCFKGLGRALWTMEGRSFPLQKCVWSMGAALFAHVISFMSVSYFDQNILFWYLLLAMISTASVQAESMIRERAALIIPEGDAQAI